MTVTAGNVPVIEQILELARWAPSGDNTQPWRFELTGELTFVVHGFDTRETCVYDFAGRPSQISLGAMLETLAIAASGLRMRAEVSRRTAAPDDRPTFDVRLIPDAQVQPSPLIGSILKRTVQRRAMRLTALSPAQKSALERSLGPGFRVVWREPLAARVRMALLMYRNAKIRLTMPEAYRVHRDVIEFNARVSEDRIPDQAVGLDPLTTRAMQWTMASWQRTHFFNAYLGGTLLPRIELDLIPGLACAAHLVILADTAPVSIDDYVAAGRAVQRFWLTATRENLLLQPQMTPLIFGWYVRGGERFSQSPKLWEQAVATTRELDAILGDETAGNAVFCARLGAGSPPSARSLRLPLKTLITAGR